VTAVLNILAFTLIGLQLRPILEGLSQAERVRYFSGALLILAVVIGVRLLWTLAHHAAVTLNGRLFPRPATPLMGQPSAKDALAVGWSGMRGIVTLAAALALPDAFPYREFILLTAFVVVLGTLVIQGLTLRPLLALLRLPQDTIVETEVALARKTALKAATAALGQDETPAAQRLRAQYADAIGRARGGEDPRGTRDNQLRRQSVAAARTAIDDLRSSGAIGDVAFRRAEEELDWLELSARSTEVE
jgi:monovalent cation/hydrogen antiporter